LTYVNLVRGLNKDNSSQLITQIYEQVVNQIKVIQPSERLTELKDVCHYYLAFMEEEAMDSN
jgi:hypothetical protein